ncbi:MAG: FecR domain-containing protein [Deltaproteobacteria bacterium]|nr:FecR domain-containing protein [Deltaproteobacteria bacterium]
MKYIEAFKNISVRQDDELLQKKDSLKTVKNRLMSELSNNEGRSNHKGFYWGRIAAIAAVVLAGIATFLIWSDSDHSNETAKVPSRWLVSGAESESMTFFDKSKITLGSNSSARVIETAPHTVRVLLEEGEADVYVTHTDKTDWMLEAGPYTVVVTGTAFVLSWNGSSKEFSLLLKKGSVIVTGPMIEEGKIVASHNRLKAWVDEKRIEMTEEESPAQIETAEDQIGRENKNNSFSDKKKSLNRKLKNSSNDSNNSKSVSLSWSELCQEGQFKEVVEKAVARGVNDVVATETVAELMALGEAARLTRNRTIAEQTYKSVRKRFSKTKASGAAAFYLGKMAIDQYDSFKTAAYWFNIYLAEEGRGRFAMDALGRLIEAEQKTGNIAGAKSSASLYLKRFPKGTHVKMAKDLLTEY